MIRVPFNPLLQPPAPFVTVTIGDPISGAVAVDLSAQIDTAADRTLVPLAVVEALGLQAIDELRIGGVVGSNSGCHSL